MVSNGRELGDPRLELPRRRSAARSRVTSRTKTTRPGGLPSPRDGDALARAPCAVAGLRTSTSAADAGHAERRLGGGGLEERLRLLAGPRERLEHLLPRLPDVRGRLHAEELTRAPADHPAAPLAVEDDEPLVGRLEHGQESRLQKGAPLRIFAGHRAPMVLRYVADLSYPSRARMMSFSLSPRASAPWSGRSERPCSHHAAGPRPEQLDALADRRGAAPRAGEPAAARAPPPRARAGAVAAAAPLRRRPALRGPERRRRRAPARAMDRSRVDAAPHAARRVQDDHRRCTSSRTRPSFARWVTRGTRGSGGSGSRA